MNFRALSIITCSCFALAGTPRLAAIDAPVSPHAIPEVYALLAYLESIHGTQILSGQQETVDWFGNDDSTEMDHVFEVTGKMPAVRGFDYLFASDPRNGMQRIAERAIDWAEQGGIVTIAWHWFMEVDSPNGPAFYTPGAHETQFTNYDIREAMITGTPENIEFMTELDVIAADLKRLRDAGVPVLWRPFHEVGGTWFWWSAQGPEPFKWAWRTMFDRFTDYHGLTNLIWVFNPNDREILENWDPGLSYYDMVTLDVYPDSGHPVYAAEYRQYRDYTGGRKLTALSENGRIPDPDALTTEGAHWLYFCTWSGDFITGEGVNDSAFKNTVYNHERVLTLDELPDVYQFATVPVFARQPDPAVIAVGESVTLSAEVQSADALAYQWSRNGLAVAGATGPALEIAAAQVSDNGLYQLTAVNALGEATSNVIPLVVGELNGRIANLSTRAEARTGIEQLVLGFVLAGTGDRAVLMRGVGPGLVPFGLSASEVLSDPQLELFSNGTSIRSNDNWSDQDDDIAGVSGGLGAFGLAEGSHDAALLETLIPGAYTVALTGTDGGTGLTIGEMYDAGTGVGDVRLVNLSSRGYVGTGNAVLILGIVVREGPRRLLVRGIGPGLGDKGIADFLPDPVVRLVDAAGNTVFSNNDWGSAASAPELAAAFVATGAFALDDGSGDAAMIVTLPPGQYTALVSDRGSASGVALVEIYEMAP